MEAGGVVLFRKPALDRKPIASVTRSVEGFQALEQEWRRLEEANATPCLFQSWDWCDNYIRHTIDMQQQLRLRILTVRQGPRLVALLPLCVQSNKFAKVVTGLTEPFQQYTEMLLAPGVDAREVFSMMLRSLRDTDADYLHFGQVRIDSNLRRAMEGVVAPSGEEDGAPFVEIGDYPDFEAYHKTVNAKTRKNMRNARNRLERDAPVNHSVSRSGDELAEVIDRSFEGREAWLERQGLTSRAFRDKSFGIFLDRFKHPDRTRIGTVAFCLRHGANVVADQWGFIHKGRYYAFIASWNLGYEEASPGKMHLGEILANCHRLGVKTADFLIPAARYKFTWAKEATPVHDFVLPLSWRGRLHNGLWLNFLRPLAKKTLYRIPAGLRAKLLHALLPMKD